MEPVPAQIDLKIRVRYAEGETIHVVTDREGGARSFPERFRRLLQHGAGEIDQG